jgi:hypothetical protein
MLWEFRFCLCTKTGGPLLLVLVGIASARVGEDNTIDINERRLTTCTGSKCIKCTKKVNNKTVKGCWNAEWLTMNGGTGCFREFCLTPDEQKLPRYGKGKTQGGSMTRTYEFKCGLCQQFLDYSFMTVHSSREFLTRKSNISSW